MPNRQRPSCPSVFFGQGLPVGPERRVGEEDAGAEPLGELGLLDGDAEVPRATPAPACRPGRRRGRRRRGRGTSARSARAVGLVGGDAGRERDAGEPPGREPQPGPEAQDRVEHRAGRPRERAPVHGHRVVGAAPAPEEAHPVGLPLDLRLRRSVDGEDVERDERRVVRRRAAGAAPGAPCSRRSTPSRRRASRTRGWRRPRRRTPDRARRSSSARSRAGGRSGSSARRAGPRRRPRARRRPRGASRCSWSSRSKVAFSARNSTR